MQIVSGRGLAIPAGIECAHCNVPSTGAQLRMLEKKEEVRPAALVPWPPTPCQLGAARAAARARRPRARAAVQAARNYADSPKTKALMNARKEDRSASPLKVGDNFESMARKLRPFESGSSEAGSDVAEGVEEAPGTSEGRRAGEPAAVMAARPDSPVRRQLEMDAAAAAAEAGSPGAAEAGSPAGAAEAAPAEAAPAEAEERRADDAAPDAAPDAAEGAAEAEAAPASQDGTAPAEAAEAESPPGTPAVAPAEGSPAVAGEGADAGD